MREGGRTESGGREGTQVSTAAAEVTAEVTAVLTASLLCCCLNHTVVMQAFTHSPTFIVVAADC